VSDPTEAAESQAVPMADARPPATADRDAEGAAWFRARLAEVGETQGSLAQLMKRCGDLRPEKSILRSIQRMAAGDVKVPGEMRVVLHLLAKSRAKRARQAAAAQQEPPETPD